MPVIYFIFSINMNSIQPLNPKKFISGCRTLCVSSEVLSRYAGGPVDFDPPGPRV